MQLAELSFFNKLSVIYIIFLLATSPVYTHISTTLQGLAIIRNFGMQQKFIDRFFHHQNCHTQAWFFFMIATRWIAFHLDLICSLFITGVTFGAIWAKNASGK